MLAIWIDTSRSNQYRAIGFYEDHVLPHLINLTMRQKNLAAYRRRIVLAAEGRVLGIPKL